MNNEPPPYLMFVRIEAIVAPQVRKCSGRLAAVSREQFGLERDPTALDAWPVVAQTHVDGHCVD